MSGYQTPLTIKEVIEAINRREYLLPAIQREFVWSTDQIIKLFDSLMKGYTIGSFLFWEVARDKTANFQFYEFIKDYHERDNYHNPKANVTGEEKITAILDGQQRLTALYIVLKGTYAYKIGRKRWRNDNAFPKRKLYVNLLSKLDDFDLTYNFSFLTTNEASIRKNNVFWFEVGKAVEFESLKDINKFLRDNGLLESEFPEECLFGLYEVLAEKKVINYYLETSQELNKVLNIFIRVNSGGTQLSYSDLLLSIATAQWTTKDAREEITSFVDDINRIEEGFDFSKDFVLKSCLVLSDFADIAFKVDNFNAKNMKIIEEGWDRIGKALRLAIDLISSFGYNYQNLTSANAIIPIAYYILQKDNPENFILTSNFREDRERIWKWFTVSLLKRVFSGQPDNVLRPIRNIIKEKNTNFPIDQIIDRFKGTNKSISFTEDDIDNLLYLKYGKSHIFSVLVLLYPTLDFRNRFHQDHIFPRSLFGKVKLKDAGIPKEGIDFYLENVNYIANIQLLEGLPNEEKSNMDFSEWIAKTFKTDKEKKEYMEKHLIPDINLSFKNFPHFIEERKKLIANKLKSILGNDLVLSQMENAEEDEEADEAQSYESEGVTNEDTSYVLAQDANENKKAIPEKSEWRSKSNRKVNAKSNGVQLILEFLRNNGKPATMDEIVVYMQSMGYKSRTFYEWSNELVETGLAEESIKNGKKAYEATKLV